ncbi:hypothetical protein CCAX7_59320 [Capsulimonas corticalis]|uniref:Uncharacterized protein n=1 Tax=Capsulimonas corticalis TaxID=2219043 RepID=A0A402CZQ0_9BACT|nr:gluconate 2-dehydrogenase subunit 3 family protein [Capsulimonas corticalis]BDI33881.1 hypothetical protein CCAX7_59320 [Capsulimonas corticalis]
MSAIFTPLEVRTLRAAINQIIPPDDFPGGWDAGVGDYLERLLGSDFKLLSIYRQGLHGMDSAAKDAYGKEFEFLSPEEQYGFLNRVAQGQIPGQWEIAPEEFFPMLVGHVMEGYYADPGNGGNKDGVVWRMMGYEVTV